MIGVHWTSINHMDWYSFSRDKGWMTECLSPFGCLEHGGCPYNGLMRQVYEWIGTHTLVGSSTDIMHISKKIKRWIGIRSKIRYFVSQQVLVQLYYTLIYPVLTYNLISQQGNTYPTPPQPLITLQKKAAGIIAFSDFNSHSSPDSFASWGYLNKGI